MIHLDEILDIAQYEKVRDQYRSDIMKLKQTRRWFVGPNFNFLLENKETMKYQIQEMCRVERLVKDEDIQHEVNTYSQLATFSDKICLSLLIEYATAEERDKKLRELLGIENHVLLQAANITATARFDLSQMSDERVSSVQYIHFDVDDALREAILACYKDSEPLILKVNHPAYSHEKILDEAEKKSLALDIGLDI